MTLTQEQRALRAIRLRNLVSQEGWADFIEMIQEQEETILSKLLTSNHYERDEIVGELKRNRYVLDMVGRAIEEGINK